MNSLLARLKEEYERDPGNFRAYQIAAVDQHINLVSGDALTIHRLRCFVWSTVARLRNFLGSEVQFWYLIHNTLNQRIERLHRGFDRIRIYPTSNVVDLEGYRKGPFAKTTRKA